MLYFLIKDGVAVRAQEEYPGNKVAWVGPSDEAHWEYRGDFKTMERAETVAAQLNTGDDVRYVAIDSGPNVSPRFDVIELPKVGDKVSYAFNGDSYPDGEIVSITPNTFKVIKTSTGSSFYRRKQSARWVKDGMWSLVKGHVSKRNPSF